MPLWPIYVWRKVMKRLMVVITVVVWVVIWILILSTYPVGAAVYDGKAGCIVCHNIMATRVQLNDKVIDLRIDAQEYERSVHKELACTDCHMGFSDNPHVSPQEVLEGDLKGLAEKVVHKAKADVTAVVACYNCHPQEYDDVLNSVHGKNITEKGSADAALCIDCHGSAHYIKPKDEPSSTVYKFNVVRTCGTCHEKKEIVQKYGIQSDVMKTYMESFHGKKYVLGHRGAPTCVDCHGYHLVRSKEDPLSPVIGANKIQTCGKCHKGANKKFVAAITHQDPGPIPHYAEKGLIILTISVIVFTVTHVLLEAYADIRDTFFRKTKEEVEHATEEHSA
ncbi:MAG: hypothetical protein D6778_08335 [Nitrospirae bacterium]|nr:MAG: hypothetical protein D6778_08335 [Nitrospirota bacterium]